MTPTLAACAVDFARMDAGGFRCMDCAELAGRPCP